MPINFMLNEYEFKDNNALKMLKKALEEVEEQYISQSYGRIARGVQHPERAFVAELFHQLRKLQEQPNSEYQPLTFHCDIGKRNYRVDDPCLKKRFPPNKSLHPDIVLHDSQKNKKQQLLVCEVKMAFALTQKNLFKDLNKLLYYKLSDLKFKNAVFIYTGTKENIRYMTESWEANEEMNNGFIECLCKHDILFALPEKTTRKWKFYKVCRQ